MTEKMGGVFRRLRKTFGRTTLLWIAILAATPALVILISSFKVILSTIDIELFIFVFSALSISSVILRQINDGKGDYDDGE